MEGLPDGAGPLLLVLAAAAALAYYLWSARGPSSTPRPPSSHGAGSRRVLGARGNSSADMSEVVAACKESGQPWKDDSFGHDAFPGGSIGELELKEGERGKPLVIGSEGVTWQPPARFCATKRPLGTRQDGVSTWLYSDGDGDGIVSAAESMVASDVVQGSGDPPANPTRGPSIHPPPPRPC